MGPEYTIPVVKLPDGRLVIDSVKIVPELEKLAPSPPLHVDSPFHQKVQDAVIKCMELAPIMMPRVPARILNEPSAEYFYRTREVKWGMTLPELEKSDKAKNAWTAAEPGFKKLKELIHEDENGPFFMGATPSYADFVAVGFF